MEGKPLRVEKAGPLSMGLIAIGLLVSMASLMDLNGELEGIGTWAYYTVVIGAGTAVAGAIWFKGHMGRVSDFEKLIGERSKAGFIKELEELEYLAWQLPMDYERRLEEKKRHFKVK